ncbi:MAG: 3-deoxy-7-phosphoheptulonate synthase [Chloroflexi bacterium]|nr:3-deoxy-7-phosphoheptulonate synthase [Chloroflexota bacterium]
MGGGTTPAKWLEAVIAAPTMLPPEGIAEAVPAFVCDGSGAGEAVAVRKSAVSTRVARTRPPVDNACNITGIHVDMIIHMAEGATPEQTQRVIDRITHDYGLRCETIVGDTTVIGVKGIAGVIDEGRVTELPGVDRVIRISVKYKDASRQFHHEDTVVNVAGVPIGGQHLTVFGGPCAIETERQAIDSALMAKAAGVDVLRAFVDKSRTSPYDYRGLELGRGLEVAAAMKAETGLPTVSELIDLRHLDAFLEAGIDIIQVGARSAQYSPLLEELSRMRVPIVLKHGFGNDLTEWLCAAAFIMSGLDREGRSVGHGNPNVILCYRGIKSFETETRFAADIAMIPLVRSRSHLPLLADPSHSSGDRKLVERVAYGFVAAGANGFEFDIHSNPAEALCDGKQAVGVEAGRIIRNARGIHAMLAGVGYETGASLAAAAK